MHGQCCFCAGDLRDHLLRGEEAVFTGLVLSSYLGLSENVGYIPNEIAI